MIEKEKVLSGLHCRGQDLLIDPPACDGCKYHVLFANCIIGCDFRRLCRDAIDLLKEQGWHLIREDADGYLHGLPGDDGQYIMTDGNDIWIDDYVDGGDDGVWLDSCRDIREIKAWMYMPKLPILD